MLINKTFHTGNLIHKIDIDYIRKYIDDFDTLPGIIPDKVAEYSKLVKKTQNEKYVEYKDFVKCFKRNHMIVLLNVDIQYIYGDIYCAIIFPKCAYSYSPDYMSCKVTNIQMENSIFINREMCTEYEFDRSQFVSTCFINYFPKYDVADGSYPVCPIHFDLDQCEGYIDIVNLSKGDTKYGIYKFDMTRCNLYMTFTGIDKILFYQINDSYASIYDNYPEKIFVSTIKKSQIDIKRNQSNCKSIELYNFDYYGETFTRISDSTIKCYTYVDNRGSSIEDIHISGFTINDAILYGSEVYVSADAIAFSYVNPRNISTDPIKFIHCCIDQSSIIETGSEIELIDSIYYTQDLMNKTSSYGYKLVHMSYGDKFDNPGEVYSIPEFFYECNCILKVKLPEDARVMDLPGIKSRADKVIPIELYDFKTGELIVDENGNINQCKEATIEAYVIYSNYNPNFFYRIGEEISVEDFDESNKQCTKGIHFCYDLCSLIKYSDQFYDEIPMGVFKIFNKELMDNTSMKYIWNQLKLIDKNC